MNYKGDEQMLEKAVAFSHTLLKATVKRGETVIDATVGKGNDTLFLASLVGEKGHVFGFDVQAEAISITQEKCFTAGVSAQVTLHHTGHEHAYKYVAADYCALGAVIYNLGYLPGSDKHITTLRESTLTSMDTLLPRLRLGGLMLLVVYSGHSQGKEEKEGVLDYVANLDQDYYSVLRYEFINQKNNPPFLLAIEKRKHVPTS